MRERKRRRKKLVLRFRFPAFLTVGVPHVAVPVDDVDCYGREHLGRRGLLALPLGERRRRDGSASTSGGGIELLHLAAAPSSRKNGVGSTQNRLPSFSCSGIVAFGPLFFFLLFSLLSVFLSRQTLARAKAFTPPCALAERRTERMAGMDK